MENENKEEISINDPDLNLLCIFSFDVILSFFDKKEEIKPNFPEKFKKYSYPLFVTWSKGEDHHLRGCIGTFTSDNLEKNLAAYSLYAAFKDSRFPPLKLEEVKDLNCGISLLVNFENVDNIYDWEIGKHGIQIEFESDRYYRGTYLPEVAKEQEWDHKKTLKSLVRKAGYYGKYEDVEGLIKLKRYMSIKINMTYMDYLNSKK